MSQDLPEIGETVLVEWGNKSGPVCGLTKGFVVGVFRGEPSVDYLVLDQSTYQDTFKSNILSLGILDLEVIPMNLVKKLEKIAIRKRPPGSNEKFTGLVWAHFRSNIDFHTTFQKVKKRADCKSYRPPKNSKRASEGEYQIVIQEIKALEKATITIYSNGALQIKCKVGQLNKVKEWIREAVELLPHHRRLVLFQTSFKYAIWDTYKEWAYPAEEIIEGIGKLEKGPPIADFNIGWTHHFFVELPDNPLQKLLPHLRPLDKFLIRNEKNKKPN